MDNYYILIKKKLKSFLNEVMRDYYLISPQQANNGDFLFQETKDLENIDLNYDITSNTLKEFFFPSRETIFKYQKRDGSFQITPEQETNPKTIFFGVRSCDIRAVYFQDKFFTQEPKDQLYWRKRDKGILLSFACNKPPRQSCFCTSTQNAGPVLDKGDGFDLQFIDLAKIYLVEIGTHKGNQLIKEYKRFFTPLEKATDKRENSLTGFTLANKKMQDKKLYLKDNCVAQFQKEYDIMYIYDKLKSTDTRGLWEELGKRCTSCGGCEFICPTCFCFSAQDIEYSHKRGERIRAWDSCIFSGYSRMAQDVNPHERNADRISRRFFCKLHNCYNWFKLFACTGCGRCSFVCPVNLDMESFISSLMRSDKYQPLLKEL